MSTIVYQGLQSCSTTFEFQVIETTTLKLKVSTPCMISNHHVEEKCHTPTPNKQDFGGWTFLQNLSNISSLSQKDETIYVHPLSQKKSSYSRLSDKSLELCTESLGSETGTDIITESSNIFSFSNSSNAYSTIEKSPLSSSSSTDQSSSTWSRTCNKVINKNITKKKSFGKFPPPLTTIRGLNSVQFRPHREDGRLIIKAVETPLTHNYLQAERSNGRLRLCFSNFDSEMTLEENEELDVTENEIIDNDTMEKEEEMEENEEEVETEEEEEQESDDVSMKWDIDGNNKNVEAEIGMEKCQWLSRCKESGGQSNKAFCDWRNNKPLWVATS